jgi:hypothetical protein
MTNAPSSPDAPAARSISGAVFLAVIATLLAIAAGSLFLPTASVEGVPNDPSARAARDLMWRRLVPPAGGLRFASAFTGEAIEPGVPRPGESALLDRAAELLWRSVRAHPLEPRSLAALGHVELARRRPERAARYYRRAIDLRAHCSEARLGLGVALALEADRTADALERRALELAALAQFTAVDSRSARWLDAQFDRVILLRRVGRRAEADLAARAYFARDTASAWAARLREGPAEAATGGSGRSASGRP